MIDAGRVREILVDCLTDEDAMMVEGVMVEGILHTYRFNQDKLDEHRLEVAGMLAHLPIQFRPAAMGGSGGWSFLNACNDDQDEQWTGEHMTMEALLCLGIGMKMATWLLPREMWEALPGGMPYVAVLV